MEMVRAFIGFVAGLFVMAIIAFSGAFDGIPHWWSRNVTHWNAGARNDDPNQHSRYTVRAVYEPQDGGGANCLPHYEFHNRTDRIVRFHSDDSDDQAYGPAGGSSNAPISLQPANGGPPPYGPPNSGSSPNGPPPSYGGGGQGYGDDSYEPRSGGDADYGDDRYYDEYPGDAEREEGGCSGGTVKIYLDRDKKP